MTAASGHDPAPPCRVSRWRSLVRRGNFRALGVDLAASPRADGWESELGAALDDVVRVGRFEIGWGLFIVVAVVVGLVTSL